ncbi:hypothetical protein CAAN3_25S01046 [[Candida] anglica]
MNGGPSKDIKLGYYDPFGVFSILEPNLKSKFPLTNLHWKYEATKPLKSIPLLPVDLVEEIPKSAGTASSDMYLRMMLVKCDSIDTYRSQVRPLIKEWLRLMVFSSPHTEWMIVQLIPANAKDKHSTIMKLSIQDKLRIDFGLDGKELPASYINRSNSRILKMKEVYEDEVTKLEAYSSMAAQIKDQLLTSFNDRHIELQNALMEKKIDRYQQFLLELKLAELLNDMRLYEDSLKLYTQLIENTNKLPEIRSHFSKFQVVFPENFNDYNFESSFDTTNIKNRILSENEPHRSINDFELKCFLFIQQSLLLQSLAGQGKSISLSALNVATLFQKLIVFLQDVTTKLSKDPKVHEWSYVVVDNYLKLPIYEALLREQQQRESPDESHPFKEILECCGELKIFQRSQLTKLGHLSYRYKLYGPAVIIDEILMDDISLDDDGDDLSVTSKEKPSVSYPPIVHALSSEENFYDMFQMITESIIQDFVASERVKSIDVLSIDIALIKLYRGKYQEALDILEDSYDFFIRNGWMFMGGILLEAYLKCIEKVTITDERNLLILNTCLTLLANLNNGRRDTGINNYSLVKNVQKVSTLFEKIYFYSRQLDQDQRVEFDLHEIFNVKLVPFIKSDKKSDIYFVDIEVINEFGVDVKVLDIVLKMENNSGDTIEFVKRDCTISSRSGPNKIRLNSKSFLQGALRTTGFQIRFSNNLILVDKTDHHDQDNMPGILEEADETVVFYNSRSLERMRSLPTQKKVCGHRLLCYPRWGNFRAEFKNVPHVTLGKTSVLLRIYGGSVDITNGTIKVENFTAGGSIPEIIDSGSRYRYENGNFIIPQIKAKSIMDIKIPYINLGDKKLISLKGEISYFENEEEFSHVFYEEIDTSLTIAVSVQDIFKLDYIFSKFQVGTSNSKYPIRILSNDLCSPNNHNYKITKPATDANIVALGEQPGSFFYKIQPNEGYIIQADDILELNIRYQNISEEASRSFEKYVLSQFEPEALDPYWFLLKKYVFDLVVIDINIFALHGMVKVVNIDKAQVMLDEVISQHVQKSSHQDILKRTFNLIFASSFTEEDNEDTGDIDVYDEAIPLEEKMLTISVPIPFLKILQIVEFQYQRKHQFIVGEPINVQMNIRPSTRWSTGATRSNSRDGEKKLKGNIIDGPSQSTIGETELFQINVLPDENWLVSGFRKTTFEVNYNDKDIQPLSYDLVLIPLNVGRILLPKLDIRSTSSVNEDGTSDVLVQNGIESVLVVPELDSITFSF